MNLVVQRRGDVEAGGAAPSRWAVASLALPVLLSSLGTSVASVATPTLARELGGSFQQVQWVVLAYLLAVTTLIIGVGRLGDLVGRRRLLLAGLALFSGASGLCGAAPDLGLLISARAAQGLGAAVLLALSLALASEAAPRAKVGAAMGLLGAVSAIGTALGPTLGGALIATCGWRSIFWLNLPLGLLALLLVQRHLPPDPPRATREPVRFDLAGTALLALTLGAYALAVTIERGHVGAPGAALLAAAALGAVLFARVEARAASPLLRPAMLREPALAGGLAMSALVTTVVMASLVVGPFYLSGALGLDATRVGLVLSCGPIVSALAGVPAGRLVDRLGARRMTSAGLLAMAAAAVVLAGTSARSGVPGYLAPLALLTAGYALFQAANTTAVMASARPDQRGVVSGLLNLSRNLGLLTGASVLGAVFALGSSTADVLAARPEAVAAGLRCTFAVAAALVVVALGVASASRARSAA